MPVPEISLYEEHEVYDKSDFFQEFADLLSPEEQELVRVIDGYAFFVNFVTIFGQYCTLLKYNNYQHGLKARFRFTNTWRKVVFIDDEHYMDFIKSN